jgi:hypothetical protein
LLKSTSTDSRGAPRKWNFLTRSGRPSMIRTWCRMLGVVPALRLGESAGLYDLLEEALTVDSPNATAKTTCVVGGMLADADSIDDLETRVEVNRGGPATACPTRSWRGSSTTTP